MRVEPVENFVGPSTVWLTERLGYLERLAREVDQEVMLAFAMVADLTKPDFKAGIAVVEGNPYHVGARLAKIGDGLLLIHEKLKATVR